VLPLWPRITARISILECIQIDEFININLLTVRDQTSKGERYRLVRRIRATSSWRAQSGTYETKPGPVYYPVRCTHDKKFKEGPSMTTREELAARSSRSAQTTTTNKGAESGVQNQQKDETGSEGPDM